MVKRRRLSDLCLNCSLPVWITAAASAVALAVLVVILSTGTVKADARLPKPTSTVELAPAIASATPTALTPQTSVAWTDKIHGLASWYGGVFNGRHTASGERFDMNAMTACHPTLPFGSLVRVKNLENKRTVVVRITDRGYLMEGRIIDLSYGAAQKLAMTKDGLAKVDLEVITLGEPHRKR